MLPREHRLRAAGDFRRVFGEGRSWAHPLLILHVAARPEGRRVGITASRKVGPAVTRNRVRRRLREALRSRLPGWRLGFDAVLIVRQAAAEADYATLTGALEELGRRARLNREPDEPEDTLYLLPRGGRESRERKRPG
jgi:ribonuclease P protein component